MALFEFTLLDDACYSLGNRLVSLESHLDRSPFLSLLGNRILLNLGGVLTGIDVSLHSSLVVDLLVDGLHLDVLPLQLDVGVSQESADLLHVGDLDRVITVSSGDGLRESNQRLKLSHSHLVRVSRVAVSLSHHDVLVFEDFGALWSECWLDLSAVLDVGLHLLHAEVRRSSRVSKSVHSNDGVGYVEVQIVVLLVKNEEEDVESTHDRRRDVHVLSQGPRPIIPSIDWVGRSQDRSSCIECGVDASLSDRNSLLLHSLVDGDLVSRVHLVELVNTADAVISQHQSSRLNGKVASLRVLQNTGSETSGTRSFARGVDGSWQESVDVLQELGLGGSWVSDDADVDVASDLHAIGSSLLYPSEELEEDTLLDVQMAMH